MPGPTLGTYVYGSISLCEHGHRTDRSQGIESHCLPPFGTVEVESHIRGSDCRKRMSLCCRSHRGATEMKKFDRFVDCSTALVSHLVFSKSMSWFGHRSLPVTWTLPASKALYTTIAPSNNRRLPSETRAWEAGAGADEEVLVRSHSYPFRFQKRIP